MTSTAKRALFGTLGVLTLGALGGVAVYLTTHVGGSVSGRSMLGGAGLGVLYAALMGGALFVAGRGLLRIVPLKSTGAVATHVVVQSVLTPAVFLAATRILQAILGDRFPMGKQAMVIISVVAFALALIATASFYLSALYQRARQAETSAMQSELAALRAKINPHFLFNALNSIASLSRLDGRKAESVTQDLADLFRYSLSSSERPLVTLADELASARLYLDIEKARFSDRLETAFDVPEALRTCALPSLTLQPLVENAVKHGVARTDGTCRVTVRAERGHEAALITVLDDGPGLNGDFESALNRGTGLRNVRDRLRIQFGDAGTLRPVPGGMQIQVPFTRPAPS